MAFTEAESIDLATAMFLHPADGKQDHPDGHQQRLEQIATLLASGAYSMPTRFLVEVDLADKIQPTRFSKLHRAAQGIVDVLLPNSPKPVMALQHGGENSDLQILTAELERVRI